MSKFSIVTAVPAKLQKGEFAFSYPSFIEEIRDSKLRVANDDKVKLTKNNMLRNALVLISMRYTVEPGIPVFNAYHIPLGDYEGLPYKTEHDLSQILVRIMEKHASKGIDAAILSKLNTRPTGTKLIYFCGPSSKSQLFIQSGLAEE